jgi:DHA2 family multidrug resistance protein
MFSKGFAMTEASFKPPSLVLSTIGLSLAVFMQVLDTTIANVALPTISGNLGVSSEQGTWVITSFAVSNAIALPLTGWLSRRIGEVKLFLWATILFVMASFLCGISTSMPELVGFRVLQGVVAGPLYPMTQTLLIAVYPPAKRGMALALLAMVTVVAPIAGPILGGWITDSYSWPWIFFINVPIGIFACMVVRSQLAARPVVTSRQPMDYIGLITLIIGVGALQIVLDKGNDLDWFESNFIIIGAVISVIALAAFVIWEMTDEHPVVNLRLFAYRNFRIGTIVLVLGYAGFFGINLILPQWLQTQMGYTATWAGLAVAPIGILPVLMSPFVGRYANKFDLRLLAGLAFVAIGASCFMRAGFTSQVDFQHVALVQLFMGIGVALFFMPTLSILMSDLPPSQIADGSGLATFLRNLGGSFAASLTTWIWIRKANEHHAYLTESITVYDPASRHMIEQLGGAGGQAYGRLEQIVSSQAYMLSTVDYFNMLGVMFAGLVLLIWLAKPPFAAKAGPAASGH